MRTSVVGEFPWAFWLVLPFASILHQVENFDRFLQGALPVRSRGFIFDRWRLNDLQMAAAPMSGEHVLARLCLSMSRWLLLFASELTRNLPETCRTAMRIS